MEYSHVVIEVSKSEDMSPQTADANQINLLAQNVDHLSVSDNSESTKFYASIVEGEDAEAVTDLQSEREMNEHLSFVSLLPFNSKEQRTMIPGCHKCMIDDSCNDSWCVFCTRGFCHRGQLCSNIYSHFAMCGNDTNYCRVNRLRNPQNDRNVRRIQSSGHGGNGRCVLCGRKKMRVRLKNYRKRKLVSFRF